MMSPLHCRSSPRRRTTIKQPQGNLTGLKPNQVKSLERLYRRRISPGEVVSRELARELAEISLEIRRQIGILVSRIGEVAYVVVGDESGLLIPALADYPLGKRLLRGLRLVHTHLKGEPLSVDDLTDLSLCRVDLSLSPYRYTCPFALPPGFPDDVTLTCIYLAIVAGPSQNRAGAIYAHGSSHGNSQSFSTC